MSTTFSGPVRSRAGFYNKGAGSVINLADGTNTLTLNPADYAGRIIRVNDATLVLTLPTISASTDPNVNNIGVSYTFFIETASTALKISTDGTDKYFGSLSMVDTDSAGAVTAFAPATTNDNINFNGTTTGGLVGSWVTVTAIAALEYFVQGVVLANGTVVTPFADA